VPVGLPSTVPAELPVRVAPTEPVPDEDSQPKTDITGTLAQLIDQGVLALGYLWLCCGIVALAAFGGALIWFFRRSRRQ